MLSFNLLKLVFKALVFEFSALQLLSELLLELLDAFAVPFCLLLMLLDFSLALGQQCLHLDQL